MAPERRTDRPGTGTNPGHLRLIRNDLAWLHTAWLDLVFPGQRNPHPTMGRWSPSTGVERVKFWLWGGLGGVLIAVIYPFVVAGLAVRFYGRRLYGAATAIGVLGVLLVTAVAWGALAAGAYLRSFPLEGVIAVAAGGGVAAVSAVLAVLFSKWDGRPTTVALASPFAVTALFLPPVVAALYSQALADWVFPNSYVLAEWLLDNPLSTIGVAGYLRSRFELVGLAYVGMWFALAVPVGWILGLLGTLADLVRPAPPDREE